MSAGEIRCFDGKEPGAVLHRLRVKGATLFQIAPAAKPATFCVFVPSAGVR